MNKNYIFFFIAFTSLVLLLFLSPKLIEEKVYHSSEMVTVNRNKLNTESSISLPEKMILANEQWSGQNRTYVDEDRVKVLKKSLEELFQALNLPLEKFIITNGKAELVEDLVFWNTHFVSTQSDAYGDFVVDDSTSQILQFSIFYYDPIKKVSKKELVTNYLGYLGLKEEKIKQDKDIFEVQLETGEIINFMFDEQDSYFNMQAYVKVINP